jgi:hypothetical protein
VTELEQALRALDVEWPETPDIAGVVRERIGTAPAVTRRRRPRLAWVAASLVVVLGGVAAVPDARSAVLRWLGLKGVEIRREAPRATPPPRSPTGSTLGLGATVSLAEARRRAPVLVPRRLGAPKAVYLGPLENGPDAVSLVYPPGPGMPASRVTGVAVLVQTIRATAEPLIKKTAGAAAAVEDLTVDGHPAYWITGSHGFGYVARKGQMGFERERLADRTLLVERDGLLLRVEGDISRERAVAIAEDALS